MTLTRTLRFPALLALLLVLAACSTAASAEPSTGGGGGGGGGASEPEQTAAESPGGGGGGASQTDVDAVYAQLVPPNSTEVSNTSGPGYKYVYFESSDSRDSLKSFYEGAIGQAGMQIFSTTTTAEVTSFIFAQSDGSSFGGLVSISPGDGGSGSIVIVQVSTDQ